MKTKAQYEAANANDWVERGGTINKGCSVPVGGVGTTHYWIWGLQDPPFPYLQTLGSQKVLEIWQRSLHPGPAILKIASKPTQ